MDLALGLELMDARMDSVSLPVYGKSLAAGWEGFSRDPDREGGMSAIVDRKAFLAVRHVPLHKLSYKATREGQHEPTRAS